MKLFLLLQKFSFLIFVLFFSTSLFANGETQAAFHSAEHCAAILAREDISSAPVLPPFSPEFEKKLEL